jgi:hypothetical protein
MSGRDPKPDGTPPNNWLSIFGGSAWQWDARRQQYYMHNFLTTQPELNVHNPEVQDALGGRDPRSSGSTKASMASGSTRSTSTSIRRRT